MHLVAEINRNRHLIDELRLDATLPDWITINGALIHTYARASASLAGKFYLAERAAAGVAGRFTPHYAAPPPQDQVKTSLSYATSGLYGVPSPKVDTTIAGVAQRLVLNAGRRTVLQSVARDRRARGWMRETAGGCDFCQMLASRGAVYSEASADFAAHDHCECLAVPAF